MQANILNCDLVIPKEIRYNPMLTFGEKIFLSELKTVISQSEKKRFPYTLRSLSQVFCASHQTVKNWVQKLIRLELLQVISETHPEGSFEYIILNEKNQPK